MWLGKLRYRRGGRLRSSSRRGSPNAGVCAGEIGGHAGHIAHIRRPPGTPGPARPGLPAFTLLGASQGAAVLVQRAVAQLNGDGFAKVAAGGA